MVRASRASRESRERDRPLEATSSEEVKATFVLLLSAACLVIIHPFNMSTGRAFQERSQLYWPMEECTTHRQQRLTSQSAAQMPDWGRHDKYTKPLFWELVVISRPEK